MITISDSDDCHSAPLRTDVIHHLICQYIQLVIITDLYGAIYDFHS